MPKRTFGRKSLREQRIASVAAQKLWAAGAPPEKQAAAQAFIAEQEAKIKPKREHKPSGKPLEAPVIAAISELLAVHPRVLIALRMNSGAMSYTAANGRQVPVWMHKWLRSPSKMRMSDFFGMQYISLPTVKSPAMFSNQILEVEGPIYNHFIRPLAIECKAPGWAKPRDQREEEQAAFLAFIRSCGGRAGFATSVEQARAIIEGS